MANETLKFFKLMKDLSNRGLKNLEFLDENSKKLSLVGRPGGHGKNCIFIGFANDLVNSAYISCFFKAENSFSYAAALPSH